MVAIGPTSGAAKTNAEGSFAISGLSDGSYLIRATVTGAVVAEQTAIVLVSGGKQAADFTLTFQLPASRVSGRVVMSDASDASDVVVTLVAGATTRVLRPQTDGSFTFEKVPEGLSVVSASAANTLEREARSAVLVSGESAELGELRLTTVGTITGTISGLGMRQGRVALAGSATVATPDTAGRFTLPSVATGNQTLVVSTEAGVAGPTATATVTVTRGGVHPVMMTLQDRPTATGTVRGKLALYGLGPMNDLVVSVVGLPGISTTASVIGDFQLTVPVGQWTLSAVGPTFPAQDVGTVIVQEGRVSTLPTYTMSLYRAVLEERVAITTARVVRSCKTHLIVVLDQTRWVAIDHSTFATQTIIALPNTSQSDLLVECSANERFLTIVVPRGPSSPQSFALVHDLTTQRSVSLAMTDGQEVSEVRVASDSNTVFLLGRFTPSTGRRLERLKLDGTSPRVGFDQALSLDENRGFYRSRASEPYDVREVTTTGAPTTPIVANAFGFDSFQMWARVNCSGVSCGLAIAAPGASTLTLVPGLIGDWTAEGGTRAWPLMKNAVDDSLFLVDAARATFVRLPTGTETGNIQFTSDETRFAFSSENFDAGVFEVREEPLQGATGMSTPVIQGDEVTFGYLSNRRLVGARVAGEQITAAVEVRAPSATGPSTATPILPLLTATGFGPGDPQFVWQSDSLRWQVMTNDAPPIDVRPPFPGALPDAPLRDLDGSRQFGAVKWSTYSVMPIDIANGSAQPNLYTGAPPYQGLRVRGVEFFLTIGPQRLVDPRTRRVLDVEEPWLRNAGVLNGVGLIASGRPPNDARIYFAPLQ